MERAREYAHLLLRAGVNLQPGTCLWVSSQPVHWPFLTLLAEEAYDLGARFVEIDAIHPRLPRARVDRAAENELDFVPAYRKRFYDELIREPWARMDITGSEFPDLFADADAARFARMQTASRRAAKPLMEACGAGRIPWCVAALPTPRWAAKVLGVEASAQAARALWRIMLPVLRLDHPDPVRTWRNLAAACERRGRVLTAYRFARLQFEGPGTDLTVHCLEGGIWSGGAITSPDGHAFIPNLPTEEVFTAPDFRRTTGQVAVTRPVEVLGKPVVGAWFAFEGGRVEAFGADQGREQLEAFFDMDPQARCVGEVALVDCRSPIYQSGRIFHNILYDENAACHIALGSGYPVALPGGAAMSREALRTAGVNQSLLHTDFMIGNESIRVTGLTRTGETVPILVDGQFVGPFRDA
jgi:aminopeptidase